MTVYYVLCQDDESTNNLMEVLSLLKRKMAKIKDYEKFSKMVRIETAKTELYPEEELEEEELEEEETF